MEISSDQKETTKDVSSQKGGLKTMPFIIANEALDRFASVGLHANMILYLMFEYHFDSATGTSVLFLWSALSNFMPIFGAFLSDSFLGRFRVIAFGTIVSLLGMFLLWLTAIIPEAKPPECNPYQEKCSSPKPAQLALLFSSFALMSLGSGGIRPCSLAFGADQFDKPDNPKNDTILQSFFSWYYASLGISIMISIIFIVYLQDKAGWAVGFGVPAGLMLLSTVLFLLGSSLYVKVKANKSLFPGFYQVIVMAFRNKHLSLPPKNSEGRYYHNKGSKFVVPTEKLRFLNKACVIQNPEKAFEPCNICTVQQVEELKALIKVLPIWSTSIVIATIIGQQTFPLLQAKTMDRRFISNVKIPAGSFWIFGIITLTLWVTIYDRIIARQVAKFTKNPGGFTFKQRMGIGLFLSCVASAVSAMVEGLRRDRAAQEGLSEKPEAVVNMSAMWLVPQYCLMGLAEAFNAIGQIEFYYSQFPKSMSSIGMALFSLGLAFGSVLGSLIVGVVDDVTKTGGKESWVSSNLNKGHYDYYYGILTILGVVNFFYFIACSWAYGSCEGEKTWDEVEDMEGEGVLTSKESPILLTI